MQTVIDALEKKVLQRGSVTFRTREGKWIGDEQDRDLTLFPKGQCCFTTYGYSANHVLGTYRFENGERLILQLPRGREPVPKWMLQQDVRGFKLVPLTPTEKRWTLRPVGVAEEAAMQKSIAEYQRRAAAYQRKRKTDSH
jgi:hypothetical protein